MIVLQSIDITAIQKQHHMELPYYENQTHFFIGPYRREEKDACFGCFVSIAKQNGSKYYDILNEQPSSDVYYKLLKDELKYVTLEANTVLIFDKQTQNYTVKRIRKDIYCEACKDHISESNDEWIIKEDVVFDGEGRVYSFDRIIEKIDGYYDGLIDVDFGIGKNIFRDVESDVIPMFGVQSFLGEREYYSYGRTKSLAESKYIGCLEMIERYSSMMPQFKKSVYGRYDDLKEQYTIVNPEQLHLMDEEKLDEGYYIKKYDEEKKYYWTECLNLKTGEKVLLPEQAIYYDNQLIRNEERYLYETSNGTALGGTLEEAIIYSLFELIERDSFLVHWYTKKAPKRIHIEEYDNDIKLLMETMKQKGYALYLFDITLETGIPTIWAMAVNCKEDPNLMIYNAAGCHIDAKKAAKSALVEVVSSVLIYEKILHSKKQQLKYLINNPMGVISMEDHVNYYSFQEHINNFGYILENIEHLEVVTIDEMDARVDLEFSYDKILNHIHKSHPEIYIANLGNYVTDRLGLSVTKAIVPSMQPMTFGMKNERLNRKRIEKFLPKGGVINREPHPFP